MAKRKRHYGSPENAKYTEGKSPKRSYSRDSQDDRYESRGDAVLDHHREEFNDEWRHDKEAERAAYRKGKMMGGEYYAGIDARRRQEMQDGHMLFEDHRAIANLPQEVMIKPYPRTGPYMPEGLDDTGEGVDRQMDMDDSQRRKHFFPKKV